MGNLICYWKNHYYDIPKYREDMEKFHKFNHDLPFKTREEIEDFYDNPPLPFCVRCKKEINIFKERS